MTIEKDQQPILTAIINGTYAPVLKRAMANSFLLGIEQLRMDNFKGQTEKFMSAIYSYEGQKACREILARIEEHKSDMIIELMKQYGIDRDKDAFNQYFDELTVWFKRHMALLHNLVFDKRFDAITRLTKIDEDKQ